MILSFWKHHFSGFEVRADKPFHCATNRLFHPNKQFYTPNDNPDQSPKSAFRPKAQPKAIVSDYWKKPESNFYPPIIWLHSSVRWTKKVRAIFYRNLQSRLR